MSTQNTAGDPASEGAGGVAFEDLPDRPTIRKAVAATEDGTPALLEFVTTREKTYSTFDYVTYQG